MFPAPEIVDPMLASTRFPSIPASARFVGLGPGPGLGPPVEPADDVAEREDGAAESAGESGAGDEGGRCVAAERGGREDDGGEGGGGRGGDDAAADAVVIGAAAGALRVGRIGGVGGSGSGQVGGSGAEVMAGGLALCGFWGSRSRFLVKGEGARCGLDEVRWASRRPGWLGGGRAGGGEMRCLIWPSSSEMTTAGMEGR